MHMPQEGGGARLKEEREREARELGEKRKSRKGLNQNELRSKQRPRQCVAGQEKIKPAAERTSTAAVAVATTTTTTTSQSGVFFCCILFDLNFFFWKTSSWTWNLLSFQKLRLVVSYPISQIVGAAFFARAHFLKRGRAAEGAKAHTENFIFVLKELGTTKKIKKTSQQARRVCIIVLFNGFSTRQLHCVATAPPSSPVRCGSDWSNSVQFGFSWSVFYSQRVAVTARDCLRLPGSYLTARFALSLGSRRRRRQTLPLCGRRLSRQFASFPNYWRYFFIYHSCIPLWSAN